MTQRRIRKEKHCLRAKQKTQTKKKLLLELENQKTRQQRKVIIYLWQLENQEKLKTITKTMGIKEVLGEEEGKGESTWNICSSSWRDKYSAKLL